MPRGPTRGALYLILALGILQVAVAAFVGFGYAQDRKDRDQLETTQGCLVGYATQLTGTLKLLAQGTKDTRKAAIVLWGPPGGIYVLIKDPSEAGVGKILDDIKTYTSGLREGNRQAAKNTYPVIGPCLKGDVPPFQLPSPSTSSSPSP